MSWRGRLSVVLGLVVSLLVPFAGARGQVVEEARALLDAGQEREALALLKEHRSAWDAQRDLAVLAARAYAAAGNSSWATRTLLRQVELRPDDCCVRGELAWLFLSQADYRRAREVLGAAPCPGPAQETVRWHLLGAMAARQGQEPDLLRARLAAARRGQRMYPEDRALFTFLRPSAWPLRGPSLELTASLQEGWRSNPLLGSPLDQQASGEDFASFYTSLDLWGRIASPYWGPVRVFLEGDGKGKALYARAARGLSHAGWGLRPGFELSWPTFVLRGAYHFDALWVATADEFGDRSNWFYHGHRGELELEFAPGVTAFMGGGHRRFRTMGRTRWEMDLGVGAGRTLGARVSLLGAVTGRMHRATNDAYNVWGGTALISSRIRLFGAWSLRLFVSGAIDHFPDSAGSEAFHAPKERRDLQVRGRVGFWTPTFWGGLQAGLRYQPTRRFSTAELYDFMDHTVVVLLNYRLSGDAWLPRREGGGPGCLPLDYRIGAGEDVLGERLQDLLRQDEEAQRGSSCMD